jgi:hypothetical protein
VPRGAISGKLADVSDRACLNCGSPQVARFCANCGQQNRGSHRSLAQFGYDFIGDFRSFDTKFWLTLSLLVFRPGRLTIEFNLGRRVRYLHPRKMYLVVSIAFFLLLSLLSDARLFDIARYSPRTHALMHRDIVQTAVDVAQTAGSVEHRLDQALPEHPQQTLRPTLDRRIDELRHMDREVLRERFTHGISSNIAKMVFLLLPVFALLVMLWLGGKQTVYVDHLVFAFHAHIYFFIIACVCLISEAATRNTRAASLGLLATAPYLLLSAHAVYKRTWLQTLARLLAVLAAYSVVLAVSVGALAAATLWWL